MLNTGAAEVAQCFEGGDFEESDLIIILLPSGQTQLDPRENDYGWAKKMR